MSEENNVFKLPLKTPEKKESSLTIDKIKSLSDAMKFIGQSEKLEDEETKQIAQRLKNEAQTAIAIYGSDVDPNWFDGYDWIIKAVDTYFPEI